MGNRIGTLLLILNGWKIYTTNSKNNYLFHLMFITNGKTEGRTGWSPLLTLHSRCTASRRPGVLHKLSRAVHQLHAAWGSRMAEPQRTQPFWQHCEKPKLP